MWGGDVFAWKKNPKQKQQQQQQQFGILELPLHTNIGYYWMTKMERSLNEFSTPEHIVVFFIIGN